MIAIVVNVRMMVVSVRTQMRDTVTMEMWDEKELVKEKVGKMEEEDKFKKKT